MTRVKVYRLFLHWLEPPWAGLTPLMYESVHHPNRNFGLLVLGPISLIWLFQSLARSSPTPVILVKSHARQQMQVIWHKSEISQALRLWRCPLSRVWTDWPSFAGQEPPTLPTGISRPFKPSPMNPIECHLVQHPSFTPSTTTQEWFNLYELHIGTIYYRIFATFFQVPTWHRIPTPRFNLFLLIVLRNSMVCPHLRFFVPNLTTPQWSSRHYWEFIITGALYVWNPQVQFIVLLVWQADDPPNSAQNNIDVLHVRLRTM